MSNPDIAELRNHLSANHDDTMAVVLTRYPLMFLVCLTAADPQGEGRFGVSDLAVAAARAAFETVGWLPEVPRGMAEMAASSLGTRDQWATMGEYLATHDIEAIAVGTGAHMGDIVTTISSANFGRDVLLAAALGAFQKALQPADASLDLNISYCEAVAKRFFDDGELTMLATRYDGTILALCSPTEATHVYDLARATATAR